MEGILLTFSSSACIEDTFGYTIVEPCLMIESLLWSFEAVVFGVTYDRREPLLPGSKLQRDTGVVSVKRMVLMISQFPRRI